MESQTVGNEWVPIGGQERVHETSLAAHEKSVNDRLNALMNEQRSMENEQEPRTNGHAPQTNETFDEFPMSVEVDDDQQAHDPEPESERLGEQHGHGKWTATINGDDSPDLPPRAPEIKNPLLPLKIKRGQSAVAVTNGPTPEKRKRGPYKKSQKQSNKETTVGKGRKTPVKVKINTSVASPSTPSEHSETGRRARRATTTKKYTFSDNEEEDSPLDYAPEDDGGEFEVEAPKKKTKGPGRPKGRPPKNATAKSSSKATALKAPSTPPKKQPPKGISKGPTKDTLVITKEEYKRLASIEKAFLKVKELNREMFMIMLQETKKQKEADEKVSGPSGSTNSS